MAQHALKYDVGPSRSRLALIIVNTIFEEDTKQTERKGQDIDADRFRDVLPSLGFDVRYHHNQTTTQMLGLVKKVAEEAPTNIDCFMLVLSTHGDWDDDTKQIFDIVYGTEGTVSLDELLQPLRSSECPVLAGKPKLFFIQACRGTKLDQSVKIRNLESGEVLSREVEEVTHTGSKIAHTGIGYPPEFHHDGSMPYHVPIYKDFLLAYATPPGYVAFKTKDGSPFLRYVCERLASEGTTVDIMTLLTHVNRDMATGYQSNAPRKAYKGIHQRKTVPWVASMLTKQLIFNESKP